MKWFLFFWAAPVAFLAGWYELSYHDINFGVFMLSRQAHDLIFGIYGQILGVEPQTVPPMIAKAIGVDSLFVFALMAFRRRTRILAWWQARRRAGHASLHSKKSLSSAP